MLAYILAVLVGTGSVGLYIAAFFFPEIHRKQDFIWSGVGFFYALTLWVYARQSMGGIVVGQTASVALLGWFGWQTLKLRRQLVPTNQQTPIPKIAQIQQQVGLKPTATKPPTKSRPAVTPSPIEEEEKASIVFQLKPPTASKPLGHPVKPPAPPEPPQAEITVDRAIVEVADSIDNSTTTIDLELKSIELIVNMDNESKDESSS
jgi:Ycf66 protein N-terminus